MLKGKIHIDLPSAETDRRRGPVELVRSWFGADINLASGKEELTISALAIVETTVIAFRAAGINNAISFLVDKVVVFKDVDDQDDDLPALFAAAKSSGILDRPFKEMHLVVTDNRQKVHTLWDVRVQNEVMLGDAEMSIEVSGRIEPLRINDGESAEDYAKRIREFTSHDGAGNAWRDAFHAQVERVTAAFAQQMVSAKVWCDPSKIQLIRPNKKQIGNFRNLKFGNDVQRPTYRAVPTRQRHGAYADPFYYYYYDPYYDYTSWLMYDAMLHHDAWHHEHVCVVEPSGDMLFTGTEAATHVDDSWDGAGAVTYDTAGGMCVDESIPAYSGDISSDDASVSDFSGSDSSSFFGGSDVDSGSSDTSSSCGSSCGSSCSSCGSSCGGCS